MVGPFAPSESGLESVIQRSVNKDLNRRDEVDVVGGRPVAAGTQVCVSRVVRSRTPLSAHNVIGSVVIHGKHVLLREDVAIRLNAEVLLNTLKDGARLQHVATELLAVTSCRWVIDVDL